VFLSATFVFFKLAARVCDGDGGDGSGDGDSDADDDGDDDGDDDDDDDDDDVVTDNDNYDNGFKIIKSAIMLYQNVGRNKHTNSHSVLERQRKVGSWIVPSFALARKKIERNHQSSTETDLRPQDSHRVSMHKYGEMCENANECEIFARRKAVEKCGE
jgi:hypothetical protein